MANYTVEKVEEYPVLPADTIVPVQVIAIEEREVNSQKGNWMKLEFTFQVLDVPEALQEEFGGLVGRNIWGSVPARLTTHSDNKLRQWSEALLGLELGEGFALDTDDLIGKKARGMVSNYEKRDGKLGHQIQALLPFAPGAVPTGWGQRKAEQEKDAFAALEGAGIVGTVVEDTPPF